MGLIVWAPQGSGPQTVHGLESHTWIDPDIILQGVGLTLLAHSLSVNGVLSIHFSTVVSRAEIRTLFTGWRSGQGGGGGGGGRMGGPYTY